jgi:hypothetical protein
MEDLRFDIPQIKVGGIPGSGIVLDIDGKLINFICVMIIVVMKGGFKNV